MKKATPFENCLLPLLGSMHWHGSLRKIKEAMPYFESITTERSFRQVLENLNYESQPLAIKKGLDTRLFPALIVTKNSEACVLLAYEKNEYKVFNGLRNEEMRIAESDFPAFISGSTAYVFKPRDKSDEALETRGWFWRTLRINKALVISAMFLSFILSLLMLATPIFVMSVYDSVIGASSYPMLNEFGVGIVLALVGSVVIYRVRAKQLSLLGANLSRVIGDKIMAQLLYLAPSYTETSTPGAQVARIKDFDRVREFVAGPMLTVFFEIPFIVVALIIIGIIGKFLVFIPLAMLVVFILLAYILSIKVNKWIKISAKTAAELQEFLLESMQALRVIKYTASIFPWSERYREKSAKVNLISIKLTLYDGISSTLSEIIMITSGMLVLAFGALMAMNNELELGAMLAIMIIVWRVLTPIKSIVATMPRVLQLLSSVRQIDRLMALPTEATHIARVKHEQIKFRGDIIFARVSMRYPSAFHPSMMGVTFNINAGTVVAITGRNGSGKSTVLKVLLGLYQPQAGAVLIDDGDIRQLNPIDLRMGVGYLPQNPELFFGTIADNLRLGNPTATDEMLNQAARDAGILDVILNLPEGFLTKIHDQSAQILSSSFCQSLCLARAYIRNTSILLLDEPGNTLDNEADKQLLHYLKSLKGKKTVIMVTHRPSHLREVDKIIVMDQGQVVLQGEPKDVLDKIPLNMI
ncbi:MAG: ATP-binding cassette domain-containing protein [Legionella sp.]|nr:ATP-binding cassette domain-containing protein [Legionella sp.]